MAAVMGIPRTAATSRYSCKSREPTAGEMIKYIDDCLVMSLVVGYEYCCHNL